MHTVRMRAEHRRLEEDRAGRQPWRGWGPYLSERQWGTVREDSRLDGTAWDALSHAHARSRASRWGEESLVGVNPTLQMAVQVAWVLGHLTIVGRGNAALHGRAHTCKDLRVYTKENYDRAEHQ